jgi:hypothetical protein
LVGRAQCRLIPAPPTSAQTSPAPRSISQGGYVAADGCKPRVLVTSQLDDARRDLRVDRVVSRSASIAVNQAGQSFIVVGRVQALQLPPGDSQQLARPSIGEYPRLEVVQDDDSALFSSVQDDPAINGVTESLFASGVTDSLYSHMSFNRLLDSRGYLGYVH